MKSTALGAENIIFISDAHEKFYYEKLQEVRYQDVYHKALCYCLGINGDTRKNADRIYNFKTGSVKTKCLHEGWQTSGSLKVVRMAFNLYCNSTGFIKEQYGIGGSSHALSGADDSHANYDGKGLFLARGAYGNPYTSILLSWNKVANRVAYLIKNDQFLQAEDYARMPEYEREQMANKVLRFYDRLPEEIDS